MSTRITALAALGLTAALTVPTVAASAARADSGALPAPTQTPTPAPTEAPVSGTAGVTVGAVAISRPGEPLPATLDHLGYLFAATPVKGEPAPARTTVIAPEITLAAKHAKHPAVTVSCPDDLRVAAGYQSSTPTAGRGSWSLTAGSQGSLVREARFVHHRRRDPVPAALLVVCRRPDRNGSFALHPRRTRAGETAAHVRAGRHYLHQAPGRAFRGTVWGGQPVSIVRTSASRKWVYVIADVAGIRGWISASAVR